MPKRKYKTEEERLAAKRQWNKEHREQINAYSRRYMASYRKTHPNRCTTTKEYRRNYYQKNKARIDANSKLYRLKNKEKWNAYALQKVKEWRIANPEKFKEITARRRARELQYKIDHPEIYRRTKSGRFRRIDNKRPEMSPEAKKLKQRLYSKLAWAKATPEQKERHRIQARESFQRKILQKKRERLVYVLWSIINRQRLEAEKIKLLNPDSVGSGIC